MAEKPRGVDRPIGAFDRKRSNREMSKPMISEANKETMKAPIRGASSFFEGARKAGKSFMDSSRNQYRRMTGGKR